MYRLALTALLVAASGSALADTATAGQNVPSGTYQDVVRVTVTY